MDAARWQRLSPLLDALFELDPPARERRLDELRKDDPPLAAELDALVALEDGREDFLAEPAVAPPEGPRSGQQVGPYRLDRVIGEGGMGQVWRASRADGLYERRVALKLLRPGLADTNLRLHFTRERQILARLAHPNIARLLDAGISGDGQPYLALEYVDGRPITDYCSEHDVPLEARLRMFRQVCEAVSHAHANLIVHRDLKPSNILVTPTGDVQLLDFGIAKLLDGETAMQGHTGTGTRAFTLHYAAPEQIRGEPVSTMTDVYSLGVVLYELLAGGKPYRPSRTSDAAWEEAILAGDVPRPSLAAVQGGVTGRSGSASRRRARALAGDLDNIVLKAMAPRPEQRYPSVEALALDLQRHAAGRPVLARPQSVGYRLRKYLTRHRWAVASAALVGCVVAVALASVAWQAREAVAEASRAQAMQEFVVGLFESARGGGGVDAPVDLRALLDAAVERGNRQLARQPRARAELLGVVARVRIGLGDYDQAAQLLQRQALIVDAVDGIPHGLRLESLTQRGRVLRLRGQPEACIGLMAPALRYARAEQAQLPLQAAEFKSQLGRCHRAVGARKQARQLFERALALRVGVGGDALGEVENRMDLAGLEADAGHLQVALQGFARARVQLAREVGERHALAVGIGHNLGRLHRALGQPDAAERDLRGALAVSLAVDGPSHPSTLAVRRELASLLMHDGRLGEARIELEETHRRLLARLGPHHVDLAGSHAQLARVAHELDDANAAVAAAERALAISRGSGDPLRIAEAEADLAALRRDDHPAQARGLLIRARARRASALGDEDASVAEAGLQLGAVEFDLGLGERGLAAMRKAVPRLDAAHGANDPRVREATLALAWREALAGEAGASARLRGLAAATDTGTPPQRDTAWRARAYAADVDCRSGRARDAGHELEALLAEIERAHPEGGTLRREVAAISQACRDRTATLAEGRS
ncbi:serine/threonine-protein kinase [Lysobacter sp. A3-1-A15]|uniref:serine/threonine-protein kinase n=1 Tax=Novilysobacter viscosus TaxID=3098602 RepID=UPI002EDA3FE3